MPRTNDDRRLAALWTRLATVLDSKLGLDIVTLGLVYRVEIDGPPARIMYTLTTPGCPMERAGTDGVRAAMLAVEGIDRVDTHIVAAPRPTSACQPHCRLAFARVDRTTSNAGHADDDGAAWELALVG